MANTSNWHKIPTPPPKPVPLDFSLNIRSHENRLEYRFWLQGETHNQEWLGSYNNTAEVFKMLAKMTSKTSCDKTCETCGYRYVDYCDRLGMDLPEDWRKDDFGCRWYDEQREVD